MTESCRRLPAHSSCGLTASPYLVEYCCDCDGGLVVPPPPRTSRPARTSPRQRARASAPSHGMGGLAHRRACRHICSAAPPSNLHHQFLRRRCVRRLRGLPRTDKRRTYSGLLWSSATRRDPSSRSRLRRSAGGWLGTLSFDGPSQLQRFRRSQVAARCPRAAAARSRLRRRRVLRRWRADPRGLTGSDLRRTEAAV